MKVISIQNVKDGALVSIALSEKVENYTFKNRQS